MASTAFSRGATTQPDHAPVDAFDAFQQTRFFSSLDGLRAISVIAVVWFHTSGWHTGWLSSGFLGVDYFFAISGFLITTLLLREHRATSRVSLRKFYLRRTLRILPLYYAVLLVYIVLNATVRGGTPQATEFFHNLPAFATYTSNWFVDLNEGTSVTFYFAWSLATEEQFYLFWPPLLVFCISRLRSMLVVPLAAIAVLITVSQVAQRVDSDALVWRILGSISLPILLGAAAALLLHHRRSFEVVGPVLASVAAAPVLLALVLGLIIVGAWMPLIQTAMVLSVAACCVRVSMPLNSALTWRPLAWVGAISYGVYLMHMLVANLVRPVVGVDEGITVFAATLLGVIVVASISFRFFESPILRFKERFAAHR
jgi:peptidoglycan/LPS O-acetylase OafA/YrhL